MYCLNEQYMTEMGKDLLEPHGYSAFFRKRKMCNGLMNTDVWYVLPDAEKLGYKTFVRLDFMTEN